MWMRGGGEQHRSRKNACKCRNTYCPVLGFGGSFVTAFFANAHIWSTLLFNKLANFRQKRTSVLHNYVLIYTRNTYCKTSEESLQNSSCMDSVMSIGGALYCGRYLVVCSLSLP